MLRSLMSRAALQTSAIFVVAIAAARVSARLAAATQRAKSAQVPKQAQVVSKQNTHSRDFAGKTFIVTGQCSASPVIPCI